MTQLFNRIFKITPTALTAANLIAVFPLALEAVGTRGGGNAAVCFDDASIPSKIRGVAEERVKAEIAEDIRQGRRREPSEYLVRNYLIESNDLAAASSITTFDLMEAESALDESYPDRKIIQLKDGESPEAYLKRVLRRVQKAWPYFVTEVEGAADRLQLSRSFKAKSGLIPENDFSTVAVIDPRCLPASQFIQKGVGETVTLYRDERMWTHPKQSALSRAVGFLHEAVYLVLREQTKATSSDDARRIVQGLITSEQISYYDWFRRYIGSQSALADRVFSYDANELQGRLDSISNRMLIFYLKTLREEGLQRAKGLKDRLVAELNGLYFSRSDHARRPDFTPQPLVVDGTLADLSIPSDDSPLGGMRGQLRWLDAARVWARFASDGEFSAGSDWQVQVRYQFFKKTERVEGKKIRTQYIALSKKELSDLSIKLFPKDSEGNAFDSSASLLASVRPLTVEYFNKEMAPRIQELSNLGFEKDAIDKLIAEFAGYANEGFPRKFATNAISIYVTFRYEGDDENPKDVELVLMPRDLQNSTLELWLLHRIKSLPIAAKDVNFSIPYSPFRGFWNYQKTAAIENPEP